VGALGVAEKAAGREIRGGSAIRCIYRVARRHGRPWR